MSKIPASKCCPVCGAWFYPDPHQQKYDKELCKKIAKSRRAAKSRLQSKRVK